MKNSVGAVFAVALLAGGCVTRVSAQSVQMSVAGDGAGGAWLVANDMKTDFSGGDRVERRHALKIDAAGRAVSGSPHVLPIVDAAWPRELGTAPVPDGRRFDLFTTEGKIWVLEMSGDHWRAHERTDANDLQAASVDDEGTLRIVRVTDAPAGAIRTRDSAPSPAPDFVTVEAIGFDRNTRFTTSLRGVPFGISFSRDGHIALGIARGVTIVDRDGKLRATEALDLPTMSTSRGVIALDRGAVVAWAGTSAIRVDPSGAVRRADVGFDINAGAAEGDEVILGGATDEELTVVRVDSSFGTKWRLSGCDCARAEL